MLDPVTIAPQYPTAAAEKGLKLTEWNASPTAPATPAPGPSPAPGSPSPVPAPTPTPTPAPTPTSSGGGGMLIVAGLVAGALIGGVVLLSQKKRR